MEDGTWTESINNIEILVSEDTVSEETVSEDTVSEDTVSSYER